jgi:predicted nucleotidyltransferase
LQEWLSSPVRYIDRHPVRQQSLDLLQASADLRAFEYQYDHQARRSLGEITSSGDSVRLKSYCYALRAALALHWLRERRTPPPMDLRSLMSGLDLPPHLDTEIFRLIESKLSATEQSIARRNLNLDGFIERILAQPVGQFSAVDRPDIVAQADAFFASIVQDTLANAHSNTSLIA